LTCPDDDNQWFWVGHLARVMSHAGSDLCGQEDVEKSTMGCNLPITSEPESYQMKSIEPINFLS
jgi:hypothetical protein